MVEVRSVVLSVGRLAAAGSWNIVYGQAGLTLLVKSVYFHNFGVEQAGYIFISRPGHDAWPKIFAGPYLSDTPMKWEGWIVLMPNDVLVVNTSAAGPVDFWVNGTALHSIESRYVPPASPALYVGPGPLPAEIPSAP